MIDIRRDVAVAAPNGITMGRGGSVQRSGIPSYLPTDGLISYWSLSDLTDAWSANTLTNNATATFTAGKVGNAGTLAAASLQYFSHVSNSSLQAQSTGQTIAAWVKQTTKTASRPVVSKWNNTANKREYMLYYDTTANTFLYQVSNNGSVSTTATSGIGSPTNGTYYFLVARYDPAAGTISICVNDGTVNTTAFAGPIFQSDAEFRIGGAAAVAGVQTYEDGQIDEVGLWSRALTNAEVTALYNTGTGRDFTFINPGTVTIVTVSANTLVTSNLEQTLTLVDSDLNIFPSPGRTAFIDTARTSMVGMYSRIASFIGGFGENDPLKDWDGTGAVPAIGSMFTNGIDREINLATELGIPIDFVIWRLPWQFTYNRGTSTNSTSSDYYDNPESRRLRPDKVTDYGTYIRTLGKYLMEAGARRFYVGSEWKGYQSNLDSGGAANTYDFIPYEDFYKATVDALNLAADDATGVARTDIKIGSGYSASSAKGNTDSTRISTDTIVTTTTPTETIRYKDDAGTPLWSLNNPGWGYPPKASFHAMPEFLKQCVIDTCQVNIFCMPDFATGNSDSVIVLANDFDNTRRRVQDYTRWAKRLLTDCASGAFSGLSSWLDVPEVYIKPQGTIVDTYPTNTYNNGQKPAASLSEGYLTPDAARVYAAALKAIALATAIEEGIRTWRWWGPFGSSDHRTAPLLDQGKPADEQAQYGEHVIHKGGTNQGAITAVGTALKAITQNFALGTVIKSLTVSDTSKVYALASATKCLLINKQGAWQSVRINGGATITLTSYETKVVNY